jgi:leucyl-tRNA---protein transferase
LEFDRKINESLEREEMSLDDWDTLLSAGWDRVGGHFFRRQFDYFAVPVFGEDVKISMQLMPLRYRLWTAFDWSKSQRIVQRKNQDLRVVVRPATIDEEKLTLFDQWYDVRFKRQSTIFTWVSGIDKPFPTQEVAIYKLDKLIACSYFDATPKAQYSTLAMYDPNELKRSLGTFTLMKEIENARKTAKGYHYPGHAYYENSMYEYKKKFPNVEGFDWLSERWRSLKK